MRSERGHDRIEWCKKQKDGLRLHRPKATRAYAYLRKAEAALSMHNAAKQLKAEDWMYITAYYTLYFCGYALLQRCGLSSKIHDCTLAALRRLQLPLAARLEHAKARMMLHNDDITTAKGAFPTELTAASLKSALREMRTTINTLSTEKIEQIRRTLS